MNHLQSEQVRQSQPTQSVGSWSGSQSENASPYPSIKEAVRSWFASGRFALQITPLSALAKDGAHSPQEGCAFLFAKECASERRFVAILRSVFTGVKQKNDLAGLGPDRAVAAIGE
jgi:hypothetical protein